MVFQRGLRITIAAGRIGHANVLLCVCVEYYIRESSAGKLWPCAVLSQVSIIIHSQPLITAAKGSPHDRYFDLTSTSFRIWKKEQFILYFHNQFDKKPHFEILNFTRLHSRMSFRNFFFHLFYEFFVTFDIHDSVVREALARVMLTFWGSELRAWGALYTESPSSKKGRLWNAVLYSNRRQGGGAPPDVSRQPLV